MTKKDQGVNIEVFSTENLHISLSKTIYLNYHQLESIVAKMEKNLSIFSSFNCTVDFGSFKIYSNEQSNRWFMSLLVKGGKTHYFSLIDSINQVLESFKAEKFFKVRGVLYHVLTLLGPRASHLSSVEFRKYR